jgi:hypothetical protein
MQNKKLLFLTSYLSRPLITLARKMGRDGFDVFIAAPANGNLQYFGTDRFIRLIKIRRLFGVNKIRGFDGAVIAFDGCAAALARRAGTRAGRFSGNIGIDLSIWNPGAISGNRQTMMLNRYNVQPHQKMILATDPSEKDVRALILAIQGSEHRDFIIALYGGTSRRVARRIGRRLRDAPQIIYLGAEQDLPTLMRASFAVINLSPHHLFYKIASLATGRAGAWRAGSAVQPNVLIRDGFVDAIDSLLSMTAKTREKFESENLRRAAQFDINKSAEKLKSMLK